MLNIEISLTPEWTVSLLSYILIRPHSVNTFIQILTQLCRPLSRSGLLPDYYKRHLWELLHLFELRVAWILWQTLFLQPGLEILQQTSLLKQQQESFHSGVDNWMTAYPCEVVINLWPTCTAASIGHLYLVSCLLYVCNVAFVHCVFIDKQ